MVVNVGDLGSTISNGVCYNTPLVRGYLFCEVYHLFIGCKCDIQPIIPINNTI